MNGGYELPNNIGGGVDGQSVAGRNATTGSLSHMDMDLHRISSTPLSTTNTALSSITATSSAGNRDKKILTITVCTLYNYD